MKLKTVAAGLLIALCATASNAFAEETAALVKQALLANLEATQQEDVDAVMASMHAESPSRTATKAQLSPLFERYDLKYELVDYALVGLSGEYAVARVKQRTSKVAGPAFRTNTFDSFMVYKRDDGKWKLWSMAVLEISYD